MYSVVFYTSSNASGPKPLSCLGFAFVGAHLPRLADEGELGSPMTGWHSADSLGKPLILKPSRFTLLLYFGKELRDAVGDRGWTLPFAEYVRGELKKASLKSGFIFSYFTEPRMQYNYCTHQSAFDVCQLLEGSDSLKFDVVTSFRFPHIHTPRQRAYWMAAEEMPPIWPVSGARYAYNAGGGYAYNAGGGEEFAPITIPGLYHLLMSETGMMMGGAREEQTEDGKKPTRTYLLSSFSDYFEFMKWYCRLLSSYGRRKEITLQSSEGRTSRIYRVPDSMRISEFVFLLAALYVYRFGGGFRVYAPGTLDSTVKNNSFSRPVSGSMFDTFRLPLLYFFQPTWGGRVTGNTRIDIVWDSFLDHMEFEQLLLSFLRSNQGAVPYSEVLELLQDLTE